MAQVVIFEIAAQRFGLPLTCVEQVLSVVELTSLPAAPRVVVGIINLHGAIIPVVDMRRRFRWPLRPIFITDQLLIANTSQRRLALCVDTVGAVAEYGDSDFTAVDEVVTGLEYLSGIVRGADGLVLIQDLDKLLTLDEADVLDRAIADV